MDIAAYVLAGLGGLIVAFASSHGFENKSLTIVSFGVGATLIIIGGCCYWQDAVWKTEAVPPKDRPWLNVELVPGGPIYYLPQGDHISGFFPVKFRLTNTGRSPSSEIQLKAHVFLRRHGQDTKERHRQICSWEGHPFHPGVVFPGTPVEHTATWVIDVSAMKEAGVDAGHPTSEQVKHFDAYVGGCITYPCGGTPIFYGETGFLYEIQVPDLDHPGQQIVPEIGKDIPVERLRFQRYFPGSEWAK